MATYSRKETITKRVIFYVPSPSPLAEVGKAILAARTECARAKGVDVDKLYDNSVMVESFDDEIHIWYEIEEKR